MTWRSAFVAAFLALVAACASPASRLQPIEAKRLTPYQLGPGDEIRVTVFGLDALTNNYVVSDSGNISMPLVDVIPAEGKTTQELEVAVVNAVRAKNLVREPSVSVQVQKYRPFFILGEVQRPGQYPYVPGMSVLTAVSIAGGYTFRAETDFASVTRTLQDKIVEGKARPQTPILPGDTVYVYESTF